jgi:hypothetical protein
VGATKETAEQVVKTRRARRGQALEPRKRRTPKAAARTERKRVEDAAALLPRSPARTLVEYAEGAEESAFAQMLGGLIEANVSGSVDKRRDFDALRARVGVHVSDLGESVTLEFENGRLVVYEGLEPERDLTIHADAETVMQLSSLRVGFARIPIYFDAVGRDLVGRILRGRLRIDGVPGNLTTLNRVTRIFSVHGVEC